MISICLRSSSNIVSGLSEGVTSAEGVYQDVFFFIIISSTVSKYDPSFVSQRFPLIPEQQHKYAA